VECGSWILECRCRHEEGNACSQMYRDDIDMVRFNYDVLGRLFPTS
jgi:hypothetical protein